MYRSKRNQSSSIGIGSMKVAEYDKTGASHPEGKTASIWEWPGYEAIKLTYIPYREVE